MWVAWLFLLYPSRFTSVEHPNNLCKAFKYSLVQDFIQAGSVVASGERTVYNPASLFAIQSI